MQDENTGRRLDAIERNASDLARTATGIMEEIASIKAQVRELEKHHQDYRVRSAAEAERDKALQSDIANIKDDIKSIKSLGKWALTTFIGAIILAFVAFLIRGGLAP
ncbi:hemolysin XhlA family protein [Neorhizobium sp. T786]|uniref:hemolysin XhlA family protein n=1 Tax=Pseudorhizobium xiangyangii TaxID=2883104 RepID=UPI001CFF6B2F|nr:hemolysin XhlA family protein [Neorhizobium xiangyangii]MCB5201868.1 hemolysin XhlA family protein [Neorhizobium xiangyangii]